MMKSWMELGDPDKPLTMEDRFYANQAQIDRENKAYDNLPYQAHCLVCCAAGNFATFGQYQRVAEAHLDTYQGAHVMVLQ